MMTPSATTLAKCFLNHSVLTGTAPLADISCQEDTVVLLFNPDSNEGLSALTFDMSQGKAVSAALRYADFKNRVADIILTPEQTATAFSAWERIIYRHSLDDQAISFELTCAHHAVERIRVALGDTPPVEMTAKLEAIKNALRAFQDELDKVFPETGLDG